MQKLGTGIISLVSLDLLSTLAALG
jgi:hypothetical protein